jgi:hypothetical protein
MEWRTNSILGSGMRTQAILGRLGRTVDRVKMFGQVRTIG